MPNRVLREGILRSERVTALSPMAELFYRRLISVVDDYGRYTAHLTLLRSACWPMSFERVSDKQVSEWLLECSKPVENDDRHDDRHDDGSRARASESKAESKADDRRPPSTEAPGSDPEPPPLKNPEDKTPETEAEKIAWCRESLIGFVQDCEAKSWKVPDDEICRQVLAAGNGCSVALLGQTLREIHRKGKRPEVSWAWFPKMIGEILNPPKIPHATKGTKIPFLREAAGQ